MEKILISEFKAKCIAILHKVNTTGESVIITRRGKPIVQIDPVRSDSSRKLGGLGKLEILGDIIYTDSTEDWEILNESSN